MSFRFNFAQLWKTNNSIKIPISVIFSMRYCGLQSIDNYPLLLFIYHLTNAGGREPFILKRL